MHFARTDRKLARRVRRDEAGDGGAGHGFGASRAGSPGRGRSEPAAGLYERDGADREPLAHLPPQPSSGRADGAPERRTDGLPNGCVRTRATRRPCAAHLRYCPIAADRWSCRNGSRASVSAGERCGADPSVLAAVIRFGRPGCGATCNIGQAQSYVDGPDRNVVDVALQRVPDRVGTSARPVLDDVADADNARTRPSLLHDREMANVAVDHLAHELVDGRIRRARPNIAGHEIRCRLGQNVGAPIGDAALTMSRSERMPAIPTVLVEDEDGSDARVAQDPGHPLDRVRRRHADDLGALVLDDFGDTHGADPPAAGLFAASGLPVQGAFIGRGERSMVPCRRTSNRCCVESMERVLRYSTNVSQI